MIPYVSIDIETTGLDPESCQIIEFAAVIDNWLDPVDKLPTFQTYVRHWKIQGEPFALAMNSAILKEIANCKQVEFEPPFTTEKLLLTQFAKWLRDHGIDPLDIQPAGKNFASFDRQFLQKLTGYRSHVKFKHRTIDPAMFYWTPGEDVPNTEECKKRATVHSKRVCHRALDDALDVVDLVREHWYRAYQAFAPCPILMPPAGDIIPSVLPEDVPIAWKRSTNGPPDFENTPRFDDPTEHM